MKRKVSLVLGSIVGLASLAAAVNLPVSVPVMFDALSGVGAAAGLLILFSHDYSHSLPEPRAAVHTKRRKVPHLAARKVYASRTVHALVEATH